LSVTRPTILLLGDTLNLGGTEGQFAEIACGLNRSRWDLHVSCLKAEGPLRARLEAAGIKAWSCGRGPFKSPRFAVAVWNLARYLRSQRIHLLHSFDFYSNILGALAARLAGTPVIIASQRDLGNLRPRFQQSFHRGVLRLAHYILVNSAAVAERVGLNGRLGRPRIVLVPNGVDADRFSPCPGSNSRPARQVIIGTLTNLRPEKGVLDFFRAAAMVHDKNPEARFVIWGDGPLRDQLTTLISNSRLETAVELRGATTEPEVALRELDIFVLPSLSEACSNALLEAMATGLSIVATHVGGNPALVEDGASGLLVPPGDPATLADAINRLIKDPSLAAEFGIHARERVLAHFSIDQMLAGIDAFYHEAVARCAA
jgi:glycosyltransferase involved in cell wall biosynthesis